MVIFCTLLSLATSVKPMCKSSILSAELQISSLKEKYKHHNTALYNIARKINLILNKKKINVKHHLGQTF